MVNAVECMSCTMHAAFVPPLLIGLFESHRVAGSFLKAVHQLRPEACLKPHFWSERLLHQRTPYSLLAK